MIEALKRPGLGPSETALLRGLATVSRTSVAAIPKDDLYVLISVGTCWDVLSYVSDGGRPPQELS